MKCLKCGGELREGAVFCSNCGEKKPEQRGETAVKKEKKNFKIIRWIMVGLGMLLFFLMGVGVAGITTREDDEEDERRKKRINLNEYVIVEFVGGNTVGKANAYIDEVAFKLDYADEITFASKKAAALYGELYGELQGDACDAFLNMVSVRVVDGDALSNGDTVTVKVDYSKEEIEALFSHEVRFEEEKFRVDGLGEYDLIDLFAACEVEFTGYSPYIKAAVRTVDSREIFMPLSYQVVNDSDFAEGDEIEIEVIHKDGQDIDEYLSDYGFYATEKRKVYTVNGEGRYLNDISEIKHEKLEEINRQTIDAIKSYCASQFTSISTYEPTYQGNYFLVKKEGIEDDNKNYLWMVYKLDAKLKRTRYYTLGEYTGTADYTYYMAVGYPNVRQDNAEQYIVEVMDYYLGENSIRLRIDMNDGIDAKYDVKGFESLETAEAACINPWVDRYIYSVNYIEN